MLSFSLSEEQLALRDLVRKFVQNEMLPNAAKYDESGEFPRPIINKAWETGMMNTVVPQKFGGLGAGVLDDVIINEEMGAGCLGITTSICVNNLGLWPILIWRHRRPNRRICASRSSRTPKLVSFCLTEPGSGTDAASLSTRRARMRATTTY